MEKDDFQNNALCAYRVPAVPRETPAMIYCDTSICGRYVSIQLMDGNDALSICEATVLGEGEHLLVSYLCNLVTGSILNSVLL